MCGIVGGVAQRNVVPILLEGLKRLEYRGYDSAGLAVVANGKIFRQREIGKVKGLEDLIKAEPFSGNIGIAHTRWATHGKPSKKNAHPHICNNKIAIVHNGIIENHQVLREAQKAEGYTFTSETDTEVIAHQVYHELETTKSLLQAVKNTIKHLEGAYALGVVSKEDENTLITCRKGSPLVIGVGFGEYFIASDVAALLPVTHRFIFLEEGDIAELKIDSLVIYDKDDQIVERPIKESTVKADAVDKGEYRHYMLKEIYEQPNAIAETLEGRFIGNKLQDSAFGHKAAGVFDKIKSVQILACGTSYHSGLVAKYWFENLARVPCNIEVASEFRYRDPVLPADTLVVTISNKAAF
jgi:glucosamine--fructose-6-phosphate aminotransferase (isomerizing)